MRGKMPYDEAGDTSSAETLGLGSQREQIVKGPRPCSKKGCRTNLLKRENPTGTNYRVEGNGFSRRESKKKKNQKSMIPRQVR